MVGLRSPELRSEVFFDKVGDAFAQDARDQVRASLLGHGAPEVAMCLNVFENDQHRPKEIGLLRRVVPSGVPLRLQGGMDIVEPAAEEVVLVAEMCVERRPTDVGAIEDVLDGDSVVALLLDELEESTAQQVVRSPDPSIRDGGFHEHLGPSRTFSPLRFSSERDAALWLLTVPAASVTLIEHAVRHKTTIPNGVSVPMRLHGSKTPRPASDPLPGDVGQAPSSRKYRMRWWTLITLSTTLLIVMVDDTIVNLALPTLQRELNASPSALQWIVNSYIVVFGGFLLTMGTLGDRFGRRRFLHVGLVLFGASSLYGAFAGSPVDLVVARAAMGIGGAMVMPSTLSIIIDVFPRAERAKAIAIWAAIAHLGIPLGPVLGGWLLDRYWWGSVLLVNVPIVLLVLVVGHLVVPESRNPATPRADLLGMALSTASLAALLYAIIAGPENGWLSAQVIGGLLLALITGIAFVAHERRAEEPMLDLGLFRDARLKWGTIAITLAMFALAGLTFDLTQFLQVVKVYSPLDAGLRILPLVIGFGVAAHVGQHLVRHIGVRRAVGGGLGAIALLLVAFAQVESTTSYWPVGSMLLLIGIALGTVFIPSTDAVMAAVPEANAGLGSALNDASRQVGAALGIGVLGSLTNAAYSAQIEGSIAGLPPDAAYMSSRSVGAAVEVARTVGGEAGAALHTAAVSAFTDAFSLAMLAGAALLSAGGLIVWRRLAVGDPNPRHATHLQTGTSLSARDGSDRPAPVTD